MNKAKRAVKCLISETSKMIQKKIRQLLNAYQLGGLIFVFCLLLKHLLWPLKIFMGPVIFSKIEMFLMLGYWPDLEHPRSFNEKIHYRKLFMPHPLAQLVADKWAVRQYVISKTNREDILNDILFEGSEPEKIPFDTLPEKFVLKATHGSGWNIIVRDKGNINRDVIIAMCRKWLHQKYSITSRNFSETHYDQIVPRILIENYIEDSIYGIPLDYKFHCFNGETKMILLSSGRFADHRENYYDLSWNEFNFLWGLPKGKGFPKPAKLDEMTFLAKQIASDFDFCRVDFYCPDDKRIIFGEITLAPASGLDRFFPKEWDFKMGSWWDLNFQGKA